MLKVETDPGSGFCGGVIRAITRAEEFLGRGGKLYSLGAIVHNEAELSRLADSGLVTVGSPADVPEGASVLIRAHGEPPATYAAARDRSLEIIDCTCPVVLRLQDRIREQLSIADGAVVATTFKYDGIFENMVDERRVAEFTLIIFLVTKFLHQNCA